jgi:spore coat polysaccharide biosynthesis protein SpsF (cytidylyltransferase family)
MMRPRVGLVLQARLASTRLRGKALACIAGHSLLERCLNRLRLGGAGQVVLATTDAPEDAALVAIASALDIPAHRGCSDDVLGRYLSAALAFGFDIVVRATGDNPAVDIDAAARAVEALRRTNADYVCEDGLPVGAGVEAFTVAALARAAALAMRPDDREHVTTYMKFRRDLFHVARVLAPAAVRRPDLRLTVDTADDLTFMRGLFARTRSAEPPLVEIIAATEPVPGSLSA